MIDRKVTNSPAGAWVCALLAAHAQLARVHEQATVQSAAETPLGADDVAVQLFVGLECLHARVAQFIAAAAAETPLDAPVGDAVVVAPQLGGLLR